MKETINSFIELGDKVVEQEEEIERLHSIIKEVRKYIENTKMFTNGDEKEFTLKETWYGKELLEILDKENKE